MPPGCRPPRPATVVDRSSSPWMIPADGEKGYADSTIADSIIACDFCGLRAADIPFRHGLADPDPAGDFRIPQLLRSLEPGGGRHRHPAFAETLRLRPGAPAIGLFL